MHSTPRQATAGIQRLYAILLLSVIVLIAMTAIIVIQHLHKNADTSRRVQTMLVRLAASASTMDALEWEAMAKLQLEDDLMKQVAQERTRIQAQTDELTATEEILEPLHEVSEKVSVYLKAMDAEFRVLAHGDLHAAREIGEKQVDPAFDALSDAIGEAMEAYDVRARRTMQHTNIGTALVIISAVGIVSLFFSRLAKAQRVLAVAKIEQQMLHQINEELEVRVQERTAELERAQHQLVATARQVGMAEVANSVLHNVGNVLNSVNVSATVMVDQLHWFTLVDFPPAVQLLHEHTADLGAFLMHDPRGRLLPAFLTLLAEHWSRERAELLKEYEALLGHVQHIKEVVKRQQALSEAAQVEKRLGVRSQCLPDGQLCIEVIDNGPGLTPEHLQQLFTHGFTTKQHGHGLGLHASFFAACEMDGTLSGHSDGPGRGARFTVLLPVRSPEQGQEAA